MVSAKRCGLPVVVVREAHPKHTTPSLEFDSSKMTEVFAALTTEMCEDQRLETGQVPVR